MVSLVRAGWELDTQGYSHADLPLLSAAELGTQVQTARTTIERLYRTARVLVLLPLGALRPDGRLGRQGRRLHRLDDRQPRLGYARRRPVPASAAARPRRDKTAQLLLLITGTRTTHIEPESY